MEDYQVTLDARLVLAEPLTEVPGYSWTLASRLGDMLQLAETQFGPCDLSYTILGIEFIASAPKIWFPGDCRHIIIQLGLECIDSMIRACWQLAHESIHLLAPTGTANVNVLEEGLAARFQNVYIQERFAMEPHPHMPGFAEAAALVTELLALDPQIIKTIRQEEPVISHVTASQIRSHYQAVSLELAEALTQRFVSLSKD